MNILKLCTFPSGGATIAARRQKEALRKIGYHCDLASISEDYYISNIDCIKNDSEITIKVPTSLWSYNEKVINAYCAENRSEISNTCFYFWNIESFLDQTLLSLCLNYDVIHLHWISGMISSRLLKKLAAHRKKIFITSHDMNHFTGGCHYSAGCDQFATGCLTCPQLITDPLNFVSSCHYHKMQALGAIRPSNWIFPSVWLEKEFEKSPLFQENEFSNVLYNCIDTEKFVYASTLDARESLRFDFGFAKDEIVFVAGAFDNSEKRKGFTYIEHAVDKIQFLLDSNIEQKFRCVIATFGKGEPRIKTHSPFVRHLHLGLADEVKIIKIFQAADLFLFPSTEENFSNAVLESLMCGCPVLAFNIGGIPDIVAHQINGYIVDKINHKLFTSTLCQLVDPNLLEMLKIKTKKWRDQHADQYSYSAVAKNLAAVYERSFTNKAKPRSVLPVKPNHESTCIYPHVFKEIFAGDSDEQEMFFANLTEIVKNKNHKKKIFLKSIYIGFRPENHPEYGRVSWLKEKSLVFFKLTQNSKPALCIRISNIDWIINMTKLALNNLVVYCNDLKAQYTLLEGIKTAFIWVVPEEKSLKYDAYNVIRLSFDKPSIPKTKDPRGLCLLHNHAGLYDLSAFDAATQHNLLTDWRACNQLLIGADQSHYIHSEWKDRRNNQAAVTNDLEAWIDFMQTTKLIMRSSA